MNSTNWLLFILNHPFIFIILTSFMSLLFPTQKQVLFPIIFEFPKNTPIDPYFLLSSTAPISQKFNNISIKPIFPLKSVRIQNIFNNRILNFRLPFSPLKFLIFKQSFSFPFPFSFLSSFSLIFPFQSHCFLFHLPHIFDRGPMPPLFWGFEICGLCLHFQVLAVYAAQVILYMWVFSLWFLAIWQFQFECFCCFQC